MKHLRLILPILFLLLCSCAQIMIREYESNLDVHFFKTANCRRIAPYEFEYTSMNKSCTLTKTHISWKQDGKLLWEKDIQSLYPYKHLDFAVPFMLRDGMHIKEMEFLLGKHFSKRGRVSFYPLSDSGELSIFHGALEFPRGMKSVTIKDSKTISNFKIPLLIK